jgi:hypothetical protein
MFDLSHVKLNFTTSVTSNTFFKLKKELTSIKDHKNNRS